MSLTRFFNAFIQFCLPATCIFCLHQTGSDQNICPSCRQSLPILTHSCVQCARHLEGEPRHLICGVCLKNPPPFDKTFALFSYAPPIISLVLNLKFHRQLSHAKLLGALLTEQMQNKWYAGHPLPDVIIPIPLHRKRLRERGFNQALEIARPIARALKIPIDYKQTKRIRHTAPQTELDAKERQKNVQNAFAVTQDYKDAHLLVIDDVITTGSTITSFCELLKKQGAKQIDVIAAARR